MTIKQQVVKIFRKVGLDLSRYDPQSHPVARRLMLMESYEVDLVLDVGAYLGAYGQELRVEGFNGRIVSFEPVPRFYKRLNALVARYEDWDTHMFALGDKTGAQTMNLAGNNASSSILPMLDKHAEAAPESKYIGQENIQVKKLDDIFTDIKKGASSVWLKIDAQGYEYNILQGATNSLRDIQTVQLEVSFIPLYEGAKSFKELFLYMDSLGFSIVGVEPFFVDKTNGELLQADVIFSRL